MPPLTASEAISPALERTKQICFRPFRFTCWLKLAVATLFTGEIATGGGNFGVPVRIPGANPGPVYTPPAGGGPILGTLASVPALLIALGMATLIIVFVLVFGYLWCRFRFTLIDTVLTGECRIGESWAKYEDAGSRMFGVYLILNSLVVGAAVGLLVLPLLSAVRSGVLRQQGSALAYLLSAGLLLILIFGLILVLFWIAIVFLKDFVAPVLALEKTTFAQAWTRVKGLAASDPGAFIVYFLLKILLAMVSGIIFGVIFFFGILFVIVPVVLVVVVTLGLTLRPHISDPASLLAALTLGKLLALIVALMGIVLAVAYVFAFLSVPAAVFFESYALYFLGSRYEPLGSILLPSPSPAPYPIVPVQAPPDFIPPHPGSEPI